MSAGDFLIMRNASSTATLPNAGSNLDALWDTEVFDEGSAASYSAGTFTLTNTAPYLIIYSETFTTTDTTNNERIEGQCRIRMDGVNLTEAAGEGYIRKSSGQQTMVINGMAIYNATAGDTFVTRFYRGDNSTTGTVSRVDGVGGVQILELDASDNFARYSTTSSQTLSSTESNVTNWTNDQQETGFSRSTDTVTLSNAGRYLMLVSGETSETGTARLGATIFLENGTTEVTGVRSYSHMRGSDGNQNGAISFGGIIDVSASDTLTLRGDADSGSMTLDSGAVWQFWQLPSGNETAIMEATNGNMNASGNFAWDTLPHIDTAAFTATAGNANIDVDQGCHLLMFWNQGKKVIDSLQRAYPSGTPSISGNKINYSSSGAYHRNSGSIGAFMAHSGAALLQTVANNSEITLYNEPLAATGTIDVEAGHFSLLNLEGLYTNYTYDFPAVITDVDTDEIISNTQTNVVITGSGFGATQGTGGKVELCEFANYTGTKVEQTNIDSWGDSSIQFDTSAGALVNSVCYMFVTPDGGSESVGFEITVGTPPETYQEAIEGMTISPDHYWRFQNNYTDEIGGATANNTSGGTPSFDGVTRLVKGDTYSFLIDSQSDYISPADQSDMNVTITANRRYIGGWIQVDKVAQSLDVIWEEGAQVNNFAFLNGFGNSLMFQAADAGGDYMQVYVDKPLIENRPYHILAEFNSSTQKSGQCYLHLDGVQQQRSNGLPWEVTVFPTHSGNISWGHEGVENLKVGDDRGIDATTIDFVSPVSCRYAHWYSWSNVTLNNSTDIRKTLFEKGALADETIADGTESAMQTSVDALADTEFPDWPCGIEIGVCTAGDFEITFDNITFNEKCSMPVRYNGSDELTLILTNGSDFDDSKLGTPYGGTITVQRPATLTINGLINGSEVRLYDDNGTGGSLGTELDGIETLSGTSFQYSHSGATNDILIQMIADNYEEILTPFTLGSSNQSLTVIPTIDLND